MRTAGGPRRDYADISSDKADENSARLEPKVSWGRFVRPGLVGPKLRLKSVNDGHPVNIPEPLKFAMRRGDGEGYAIRLLDSGSSV